MATIDIEAIAKQMLTAAKGVLSEHWGEVKPFAQQEFTALAGNLQLIAKLKLENKINEEQAKYYIEIQKSSVRIVLLTIEGLGLLAVEAAINAAIDVVRETVNTAIGWVLL